MPQMRLRRHLKVCAQLALNGVLESPERTSEQALDEGWVVHVDCYPDAAPSVEALIGALARCYLTPMQRTVIEVLLTTPPAERLTFTPLRMAIERLRGEAVAHSDLKATLSHSVRAGILDNFANGERLGYQVAEDFRSYLQTVVQRAI